MAPPPRSPATEADDCFMVRIPKDPTEYKLGSCARRTAKAGFPRIVVSTASARSPAGCRRARHRQGAAWRERSVGEVSATADLDGACARRPEGFAVGTEECSRRGSNRRMARRKNGTKKEET